MRKAEKLIRLLVLEYRQSPLGFSKDDMIHYLMNMEDEHFDDLLNTDEKELDGKRDYYGHPLDLRGHNLFNGEYSLCHIFSADNSEANAKCIFCGAQAGYFNPDFKFTPDMKKYKLAHGIIRLPSKAEPNAVNYEPKIHELVPELKNLTGEELKKILEDDED